MRHAVCTRSIVLHCDNTIRTRVEISSYFFAEQQIFHVRKQPDEGNRIAVETAGGNQPGLLRSKRAKRMALK